MIDLRSNLNLRNLVFPTNSNRNSILKNENENETKRKQRQHRDRNPKVIKVEVEVTGQEPWLLVAVSSGADTTRLSGRILTFARVGSLRELVSPTASCASAPLPVTLEPSKSTEGQPSMRDSLLLHPCTSPSPTAFRRRNPSLRS